MRRFLIAGNWKMNTTRQSGVALAGELAAVVPQAEVGVEVLVLGDQQVLHRRHLLE